MYAEERRRKIAALAAVEGRVSVAALAEMYKVTPETIRRDLWQLDRDGAVKRVHGGAVATKSFQTREYSLDDRKNTQWDAKMAIAKAALTYISPKTESIFLDAGTTTQALASLLTERHFTNVRGSTSPLGVITNSLPNSLRLAATDHVDVQLLGGQVRVITQAVVGDVALRTLAVLRADIAFIGSNALTVDHGLSTADPQEAAVKRAMITNARKVVVLCDSTKFGRDFLVSFANITDIDVIVTDEAIPNGYARELRSRGVEVVIAS